MRELRLRKFKRVATEKPFIQGAERVIVDVYGEKDGIKIFEVEERRRARLQNVAKVVRWVYRSTGATTVTMIQIFSREFYGRKMNSDEEQLAKFVGRIGCQVLKGRLEYLALPVPMAVRADPGRVRDNAREIAKSIVDTVSRSDT